MLARVLTITALFFGATQLQAEGLDYVKLASASAGYCADFLEGGSPQSDLVAMGLPARRERKHYWQYRLKSKSPNQRFDVSLSHKRNNRTAAQCTLTALFTNKLEASAFVGAAQDAFSKKGYKSFTASGLMAQTGDKVMTKGSITVEVSATYTLEGGVISTQFIRKN